MIQNPTRFITTDLTEGDKSVIYIVKKNQGFINLKFIEEDGEYTPDITVDSLYNLTSDIKLKKELDLLQGKILTLGSSYTYYNYLFTVDKTLKLLSVTLGNVPLGYEITSEIGEKLELESLTPVWKGEYTRHVLKAFIEDIFVQKL